MAAPGEFFPKQFALGVLQLASQQKQAQAELREMRSARAQRNFLEQERINLAEQNARLQHEQFGDRLAVDQKRLDLAESDFEFAKDLRKTQFEADVQFKQEQLKLQQDGLIQKGLADFQTTGSGFIPQAGIGVVADLRKAGQGDPNSDDPSSRYDIVESPVNGGVILQRVGGGPSTQDRKALAELEKIRAQTREANIGSALAYERALSTRSLTQKRQLEAQEVAASLADGDGTRTADLLQIQKAAQSFYDRQLISLQAQLDTLAFSDDTAAKSKLEQQIAALRAKRPIEVLLGESKDAKALADALPTALSASLMADIRGESRRQAGRPLQPDSLAELSRLHGNPLISVLGSSPASLLARSIEDPDSALTEADAPHVLSSNFTLGTPAGAANFHIDSQTRRLIPLNDHAHRAALSDSRIGSMLHHRWRQLGWTPEKASGSPSTASQAPAPTAPSEAPASTAQPAPDAPTAQQTDSLRTRAREVLNLLRAPGLDPSSAEALRSELTQIRDQLTNS